eukprot:gene25949-33919_t
MDNAVKIQAQIRHNAEEISSYLTDLSKDGGGTVKVNTSNIPSQDIDDTILTPANILKNNQNIDNNIEIPKSRGNVNTKDAETMERERGNNEYQLGNFQTAVKCYTKCLGLKVGNYIAFSNRAMAYLKLKEFVKAENDCTCALAIEANHVKSFQRRVTARNALGKHRAALIDIQTALSIDPTNKSLRVDEHKTKELLRNAVNRAPLVKLNISNKNSDNINEVLLGPDLPTK